MNDDGQLVAVGVQGVRRDLGEAPELLSKGSRHVGSSARSHFRLML
jgi:hypothetical protein